MRPRSSRMFPTPSRDLETRLCEELSATLGRPAIVAGMDEVGRGSLAGPCAVGVATITTSTGEPPAGLNDSKKLAAKRRLALVDPVCEWVESYGVGYGSVETINTHGIIAGLREAGLAALGQLAAPPDLILLDGSHDWLTSHDLFDQSDLPPVTTIVKGDGSVTVISAASVIAKVARDNFMAVLDDECPGYSWKSNMGYSSKAHIEALSALGPSIHHRTAWHLPGSKT